MGHVVIQTASDTDLAKILGLAKGVVRETGMGVLAPFDEQSFLETLAFLKTDPDASVLVAKDGEALVGFIGGTIEPSYWNDREKIATHMFWWTHPERRRSGVGTMLAQSFELWGKEHGATVAAFSVPPGGPAHHALSDHAEYYVPLEVRLIRRL